MMPNTPPLWKATIHTNKTDAPNLAALLELAPPAPQAVLVSEEPFEDAAAVEALYAQMPDGDFLEKLAGRPVHVALLPDVDWIKLSQEGLPPVRAGRFFVYGAFDAGKVPDGVIPLCIEAGMAFGTGHHETTALCLGILSDLAKRRRFENVLDLGCGTALIAIGAAKSWKRPVLATDIDPEAIAVARENAVKNGAAPLIRTAVADGLDHPAIATAAPFDLVVANILAGPLTHMAPSLARAVARGGTLVLSGLLEWQENAVLAFYRPHGLVLRHIRREHHWSAIILERPARRG
jgi:ribosomal protein L11 methyltransferase